MMETAFADRMADVPRSFIREILKVAIDEEVISFAGGLPNRDVFPVEELKAAAAKMFDIAGKDALQYSNTEGYLPLRQYISARYKETRGLDIPADDILITNGSQQGLDLMAKVLLDDGDSVVIEEPGYLGAIQCFSMYKANFLPVTLNNDGIDLKMLEKALQKKPKIYYSVPNFQNPSGISYSQENREKTAELVKKTSVYLIEDDPYGDLRYFGGALPSFKRYAPSNTVMLGSFSKTVVPAFRMGWIVASGQLMEKLNIAKQASDLHSNYFTQRLLYQYLTDNNLADHIKKIRNLYGSQCKAMIDALDKYFPKGISFTMPEGGMFLWVTLPGGLSSMKLFDLAIKKKVAFVPGNPFYVDKNDVSTLRLNFSCVDSATIEIGIKRLGQAIQELIAEEKEIIK
jgi:2-aminoadipate transaminase